MPSLQLDARSTVHLAIDMQRLFAEPTDWHTPAAHSILPNVMQLAQAMPDRSFFAAFMVPGTAAAAMGSWQSYYQRWSNMTGERLPPDMLDLMAPLAQVATDATLLRKTTYSVFGMPDLPARLVELGADTLVFSGLETDVCVLASIFDAVDLGFRVIAPVDAMASSSQAGHDAVIRHVLPRLPEQIELVSTASVLEALRASGLP